MHDAHDVLLLAYERESEQVMMEIDDDGGYERVMMEGMRE